MSWPRHPHRAKAGARLKTLHRKILETLAVTAIALALVAAGAACGFMLAKYQDTEHAAELAEGARQLEVSRPAPRPSPPSAAPSLSQPSLTHRSPEQVIQDLCGRLHAPSLDCLEEQRAALKDLERGAPFDIPNDLYQRIRINCEEKWSPGDFEAESHCEQHMFEAYRSGGLPAVERRERMIDEAGRP